MRYSRPSKRPALTYKHLLPSGFAQALPMQPKTRAEVPRFVVIARHDLAAIRAAAIAEALKYARSDFDTHWPIHQAEVGATIERDGRFAVVVTDYSKQYAANKLAGASSFEQFADQAIARQVEAVAKKYGYGDVGRWQVIAQTATEEEAAEHVASAQRSTLAPVVEVRAEPFNGGWRD